MSLIIKHGKSPRRLLLSTSSLANPVVRRCFRSLSAVLSKAQNPPPPPSGPIVLEQPDTFRPPSHGAHRRRTNRKRSVYYGRDLSEADKEELDSKHYPYTLPPKESFMHWFLHNRSIHVYITLGTLTTLMFIGQNMAFHKENRFPELIPSTSQLLYHPILYIRAYIDVYRANTAARSSEYLLEMEQRSEDVSRRREFRRAHGIPELQGMGAWLGLGTVEEEQRRLDEEKARQDKLQAERDLAKQERMKEPGKDKGKALLFGYFRW